MTPNVMTTATWGLVTLNYAKMKGRPREGRLTEGSPADGSAGVRLLPHQRGQPRRRPVAVAVAHTGTVASPPVKAVGPLALGMPGAF